MRPGRRSWLVVAGLALLVGVPGRAVATHFAISHDGSSSTCSVETVTITKHTAGHATDSGYTGTITLSTSTARGDWTLVSGSGTLTNAGFGAATYSFVGADAGTVQLGLANSTAETLSIGVSDGSFSEDAGEDPSLTFTNLASDTFRDEWNAVSFAGSDGTGTWATDWLEVGEGDGPGSGDIAVVSDQGGNRIRIQDNDNFGEGVQREADLSSYTTATFRFDYRRVGLDWFLDYVLVQVSGNGGASWTTLAILAGSATDAGYTTSSYDITPFIASNTRIRFRSGLFLGSSDRVYFDDVQITGTRVETCSVSDFLISHDGTGILCSAERITVTARDAGGSTITNFDEAITLDTQTGLGTWSDAGNNGIFLDAVPGDGLATYVFSSSDSGVAQFDLDYTLPTALLDVDVYLTADTSIRDDDSEGLLGFSASGFTLTGAALPNPPPDPIDSPLTDQVAGTSFDLFLAIYGTTPSDPVCGIIDVDDTLPLAFWFDYVDPVSGTRSVLVDGSAIASSEGAASAQSVVFVDGQASVSVRYKDVGRIRLHVKDTTVGAPILLLGSTNAFVVRPADLVITSIVRPDQSANPGTTTPTGTVFVAAGEPFGVEVEVRDSDGDRTPNFGNEVAPEVIRLVAASVVAPAGGRNGSNDDGAILNGTVFGTTGGDGLPTAAGAFYGGSFGWDEVGAIRLSADIADDDYLGAGNTVGTVSAPVGRFIPSQFGVAPNVPSFATGCSAGAFTYLDQPFGFAAGQEPVLTVTAQAAAGTTTQNYSGSWFRLSNASLTGRTYSILTHTLDTTGLPATGVDPAIADTGAGTGTLTFDSGAGISVERAAPLAPFDAEISLAIDVIDLDGAAYAANPARFGDTSAGNGIAFDVSKQMRFGRAVVENAHGSELVNLPVPLRAEYWDGLGFVPNAADVCTSIPTSELSLTRSPPGLSSSPAVANTPFASGDAGLTLSPPGAGNTGYVEITPDLSSATGAAVPWLLYDWPGDGNLDGVLDDAPVGRGVFGIFKGQDPVVFQREVY